MFPNAVRRNGVACRSCGWIIDERDVVWNDDLPPVPYCNDCFEDKKEDNNAE